MVGDSLVGSMGSMETLADCVNAELVAAPSPPLPRAPPSSEARRAVLAERMVRASMGEGEGRRGPAELVLTVDYVMVLLLLVYSVGSRVLFVDHPNALVFDEQHFGKFLSYYITGEYFFDIHPPIGKLVLGYVGYLTGYDVRTDGVCACMPMRLFPADVRSGDPLLYTPPVAVTSHSVYL